MANLEHLAILRQGVEVWNEWRSRNWFIRPDLFLASLSGANLSGAILIRANLSGADLSRANLSRAILKTVNFSGANLSGADFSGADLSGADLSGFDLSGVNLRGAKLSEAKFIKTQTLNSDFHSADFTNACILDWNINSETDFTDVQCDAIYLGWDYEKNEPTDRRPRDPNKIFAPGDFARIMERSQETVDLIFSQGIDWSAFLNSFQNLQISGDHGELAVQGINKKSDGSFVISVDTPLGTDKAAVERDFQAQYDAELQRLEATYQEKLQLKNDRIGDYQERVEDYKERLAEYRQQNTEMTSIIKALASQSQEPHINVPVTVEVSAMAENQPNKPVEQVQVFKNSGPTYGVAGIVKGNQIVNNNPDPSLTAFVKELQTLIAERTPNSNNTTEQMMAATDVVQVIETQPTWKAKAIQAAKGGALEVLKANPIGAFVAGAIESWTA